MELMDLKELEFFLKFDSIGKKGDNMDKKFEEMNLEEKKEAINEVLKKDILPMLAFDGGYAEVLDLKESDDETHVFIRYGGACSACSSAGGATLFAIEETLRKNLNTDKIRVFPI